MVASQTRHLWLGLSIARPLASCKQAFCKTRACCGQALFLQESFRKTCILPDARLLRPSALFLQQSFWSPRARKSENQVGQKKFEGPAGSALSRKKAVLIGNSQSDLPKRDIFPQFLVFLTPLGSNTASAADPRGPPPHPCEEIANFGRKTRFRQGKTEVSETLVWRIP